MSSSLASRRSSSSSAAKRPAAGEGGGKAAAGAAAAKKRVALGNITNVAAAANNAKFNSATWAAPVKKGSLASGRNVGTNRVSAVKSASTKPASAISRHESAPQKESVLPPKVLRIVPTAAPAPVTVPCSSFVSPMHSGDSGPQFRLMRRCRRATQ